MNKKIVKYCSDKLADMVNYYNYQDDILLEINSDLKKLRLINPVNLIKIGRYNKDTDKDFFRDFREILFDKYIKTEVVKQWLILFIGNSAISLNEIITAADNFNSKILEVYIKMNKKISLSEIRKKQIINFVLVKIKKESSNKNEFNYYIINFTDDSENKSNPEIFTKQQVEEIEKKEDSEMQISEGDILNMIFDYYFINKQKEML